MSNPASPRIGGKITSWHTFLEVLDDFENIIGNCWDSEQLPEIPSRLSTLGLQLAAWITEQTPHDPTPMLDVMRAIQAKDPLGHMAAFNVSVEEVDKLQWRWWPIKELLIDAALAAGADEGGDDPRQPAWDVDSESLQVTIDGKPYKLTAKGTVMVQALVNANGDWVSKWAQRGISKPSAVKANLPKRVRDKIETESGKGYRIKKTSRKK